MNKSSRSYYAKTSITLLGIALLWFALDRVTKIYFDSGMFSLGQDITPSILGIFHLTLVHNTGAAFGIFSDQAAGLAIVSIALSIFLIALPFAMIMRQAHNDNKYRLSFVMLISVAIVVAGGVGNGIDRFISGYVVDFICLDFMAFPVFNLADVGVVCGIAVLLIFCLRFFKENSSAPN